nr:hypothetical protein [Tanacetum cinerariifolium]
APDANKLNPSLVEDADLIAPHSNNTFCNPSIVNWNWDEVILISSDDDETNVNESIALPVEDADVEIALHHNPFLNPKLLDWYWDDVIVIPSDDDDGHAQEDIYTSKKVDSEARDKIWDEIMRYFDVYLTVKKLVKSAAAKMARSKSVYQHTMGRGGYALVKEKMDKKEIKPDEEPAHETEDKIKEGTLKVDHGIDAMTVVLGKEKGGYTRGVGSRLTYKKYF